MRRQEAVHRSSQKMVGTEQVRFWINQVGFLPEIMDISTLMGQRFCVWNKIGTRYIYIYIYIFLSQDVHIAMGLFQAI